MWHKIKTAIANMRKSDELKYLEQSVDHVDLERRLEILRRKPTFYL